MVSIESNHLFSGKKTLCFSTRHHKSFPLSLTQMKIRVPRTLAFASAKGKGKSESGVEAIVGDNASKELNWSFDFPDSKPEFSLLDSEDYQNISTVLEKLNALRSHLLAAEKWNASRLQSCDRSVRCLLYIKTCIAYCLAFAMLPHSSYVLFVAENIWNALQT